MSEGTLWIQRAITLDPRPRGFHLITTDVVREDINSKYHLTGAHGFSVTLPLFAR